MYVLLNLKDEAMLHNVVALLFSHGHRQLSIGETIENLCPTCEKSSSSSSSSSISSTGSIEMPPTEFMCSTPIKNDMIGDDKPNLKRPHSNASPILPTQSSDHSEDISVKEEPSDGGLNEDMSGDIEEDLEDFNVSQAFQLFEQQRETKPKKMRVDEPFGELYQCQLCKKSISRHGQYANLLNHLSRHARLHASKKQYCCPECGASFTRRYLASAHIKEVHLEMKMQPHDFALELREEYKSLLEICFPGADHRRKQQIVQTQVTKEAIMNILSDDSGVSLPDTSELNIGAATEKDIVEVHVSAINSRSKPASSNNSIVIDHE